MLQSAVGSGSYEQYKKYSAGIRYLPPINISEEYIYKIQNCLPPLPDFLYKIFTDKYKLSRYDADILIEDKNIALYFDKICDHTNSYKICANLVIGCIKSYLNEHALNILEIKTLTANSD